MENRGKGLERKTLSQDAEVGMVYHSHGNELPGLAGAVHMC